LTDYRPIPLGFERLPPEESVARSRAFLELMQRRRSVRMFSRESIDRELIENAVATAGTAPSGAHHQPWTFVIVSDPELKRQIREAAEVEEREFYERRATPEWLEEIRHLGTDDVKAHITDVPYLIVAFEQIHGAHGQKHYYSKESVGIAVGLLLASLHSAGLATLTHTPSPMRFLREILERPSHERPYVLIPVGYPAEAAVVPELERKPLSEILVSR